jgi:D-methionine transport system substrate-binding protein
MKKILSVFALLLTCILTLVSCGGNRENLIVVGTMAQPGEPILESIRDALKKEGFDLKVQLYSDFNAPNQALAEGSIDANLFQHEPFLNTYNEANGTDLYCAAVLYDCVYGGYSKKNITSLDQIPEGSKITIANDSSNMARCLKILDASGLITLVDELPATLNATDVMTYISSNPKNLKITPVATNMIAASLNDEDTYLGLVNATFAIAAGLTSEQLLCKEQDPEHVNANILACRTLDKDSAKIKALVKVLTTDETKAFINNQFKGTIIPYFVDLVK